MNRTHFPNTSKRSLIARLTGAFFAFLVLTVSLVGYLAYVQATRSLTQSIFDRLQAVATLKEDQLEVWVDEQRLNLVFIAWQPDIQRHTSIFFNPVQPQAEREAAYSAILEYLRFVVTSISDSDELFIIDLNGNVVISTQPDNEGHSQAESLFFQQGRTTTYVQSVYTSPHTDRPTITVATPLFDENRRRVGVLAGHLNLARIDRIILERTGLGASGETYLVNPDHEFVSAVVFASAGQPIGVRAESIGINAALNGESGADLYTNYLGTPVIGVYTWLDDREIALMAEMSQEEAFAPARQLAVTIIEVGLLSAIALTGMAYLIARQIARPILGITKAAERVASGDFTQQAPVLTNDEVGQLAITFNTMTAQLRVLYEDLEKKVTERTQDLIQANLTLENEIAERARMQAQLHHQYVYLNALHETTLGMISRLNLDDLLETLVVRAGQLLGTDHGFIYILEPGAEEIECRVGVGALNRLVGLRLKKGEGFGGTVWMTGTPQVVEDYHQWAGRLKNLDQDLIRDIVGIPIKSGEQLTGIIGLAYGREEDESHTFGSDEIELLSRFAQLAAIALDNARLFDVANEARAAAEAANESKSAFLANVSHELRTPLTSILGFARIVQKRLTERIFPLTPREDERVRRAMDQVGENLKIILSEGDRLTTLINDLLDLEKIRAGKMVWKMQPLNPAEIIEQAHQATSALFEGKHLTWVNQAPADLPVLMGDRDRLVQVCINLISNAIKFTDAGTITCCAEVVEDGHPHPEVVIHFTDQGVGIAREDQPFVFEKFMQVGDTLTKKPKGTGLGLPICKEIVEYHGGRIWLESELGRGSTFSFSLPVLPDQSMEDGWTTATTKY